MNFYRKAAGVALLTMCAATAMGQSGTNSPYSQYGLGQLSEQTSGFNRGMNGLGLGFREHNQVNYINPASYSSMDSLTFIFDTGLSGQITNFNENGTKVNAKNADFEYAVAGFRAFKHVGVSFGVIPFTNVGYNYSLSGYTDDTHTTKYTNTYSGSGGIHQVYVGAGWEFVKGLSIGANMSYVWGGYDRSVVNAYSDSYIKTLSKYYTADVNSYRLDFGLQYSLKIDRRNSLTVGLTYGLGHKLGSTPEYKVILTDPSTAVSDTTAYSVKNGLEIPATMGFGLMWNHNNRFKFGADLNLQKWGDVKFPVYNEVNNVPSYTLSSDYYQDRYKVTVGGEYCDNETARSFLKRIRYRAGASYVTPYYKVNGQDGPKELSVSAGFGIPIVNSYNNRSILNISGQWVHSSAKGLLTENTFRINIGLTFNENWFSKWKVN